jgi:3-oxoacyl-[acyl-carrier-protein] synthase-3
MIFSSEITGYGSYLPPKIVTNHDLAKIVETSDEWIVARTGIKQRHLDNELSSTMATNALQAAISSAKLTAGDIDMLILATTTPDLTFPATACLVQNNLQLVNAACFDIQAVCSGFVYALTIADSFIKSGKKKQNIAVVGVDKMSSLIDFTDRNTCVLFGDGAGAVIVSSADVASSSKIIDCKLYSDGSLNSILNTTGGAGSTGNKGAIYMNGTEVFKIAVVKMAQMIDDIVKENGYQVSDVDIVIPHQANYRIITAALNKVGIPIEKAVSTVQFHGNTSAASVPLALDYAMQNGIAKKGQLAILEAVGAGMTWGVCLVRL